MEVSIDFKDTLLKELVKNLSTKKKIQIGIFGDSGLAEVAQKMEYGANNQYVKQIDKTLNVPPRSFLEVPISDNLEKEIRLDDENKIIHEGIDYVAEQVKQEALNIVDVTFHNEGYGKWADNDPEWKEYKETHNYNPKVLGYTDKLRENVKGRIK